MLAKLLQKFYGLYASVFARKFFFKWNRFVFNLGLRGMGILTNLSKEEEYFLNKFLSGKKNKVVFDIGANAGQYASKIRKYAPDADIYSFEPHARTFQILKARSEDQHFKAFEMAIGSYEGTIKFYDYAGDTDSGTQHASVYKDVIEGIHARQSIEFEVPITTLDKFITQYNIDRIDLLKVDTEGHELDILKGGLQFIAQGNVEVIQFEFNEMNVVSRSFLKDFIDLLPDHKFYRLLQDGFIPINKYFSGYHEIFAVQNLIAVHKSSSFKAE